MGSTCIEAEDYKSALFFLSEAHKIQKNIAGEDSVEASAIELNIAKITFRQGDFKAALKTAEDAYNKIIIKDGKESEAAVWAEDNLSSMYAELGRYELAIPMQKHVIEGYSELVGELHPSVLMAKSSLALTYYDVGLFEEAISINEYLHKQMPPTNSIRYALHLSNMALAYDGAKRHQEASSIYRRALGIINSLPIKGAEAAFRAVRINVSVNCIYRHDYLCAKKMSADNLRQVIGQYGSSHATVAEAYLLEALVILFTSTNQEDAYKYAIESVALLSSQTVDNESLLRAAIVTSAKALHKKNPHGAIALMKYAVNMSNARIYGIKKLDPGLFKSYLQYLRIHGTLADWLLDSGRIDEAKLVLELSKYEEVDKYINQESYLLHPINNVAYSNQEKILIDLFDGLRQKIKRQTNALAEMGSKQNDALSVDEENLGHALGRQIKDGQEDIKKILLKLISESSPNQPDLDDNHEYSKAGYGASNIQLDSAILDVYMSEDGLSSILTTAKSITSRKKIVDSAYLAKKISNYKRLVQSPGSDARPAGHELYRLII